MTDMAPSGKKPHLGLLLVALTAGHLFGNCTVIALAAMATDLKSELAIGAEDYGWLISIYMIVQGVIALPGGLIIDYLGSRIVLFVALLTAAVGTAVVAFADGFWTAFFGMFLVGLGYGHVNPCTSKAVFDCFPPERRGSAMGIKQTGVPIGGFLGAMFAGLLVADYGRSNVLYGFAAVIAAGSLLCFFMPAHNGRLTGNPLLGMIAVMRDANLQTFNTAIGIFQASMYSMLANIGAFAREALKAEPSLAALAVATAQTASAAGRLSWGAISDFCFAARRKPVLLLIGATGTLSLLAMAAVSENWPYWLVLALALPTGFGVAGYVGVTQTVTVEISDSRLTATAVGSNRIFTSAGAALGLPAFGWIVDHFGYTPAWLALALFFAVGTAIILIWFREKPGAVAVINRERP
jgi:ACS family hexuronate transporter-like MFS transporter